MIRTALLSLGLLLAVAALCGAYHDRYDDYEHHGRPSRYHRPGYVRDKLHDISAFDLIDFIQSHGAHSRYDNHRDDHRDEEEHHEEDHESSSSEEDHEEDEDHNNSHDNDHEEDHNGHEEDHNGHEDKHEDHDWHFTLHDDLGAWSYLDTDGHTKGFFRDLIEAVCKCAHKHCYTLVDDYHNCWSAKHGVENPGKGLLGHWYDGCIGFRQTPERKNSFNFTVPFSPYHHGKLYYRAGEDHGDKNNIRGRTIGFADGWANGKICLNRQTEIIGNNDNEYHSRYYDSYDALVGALQRKEVDAILRSESSDEENLGLEAAGHTFHCTSGGLSIMAPYGSDLIPWWNDAFHHLQDTGKFAEICHDAEHKHGSHGHIECLH